MRPGCVGEGLGAAVDPVLPPVVLVAVVLVVVAADDTPAKASANATIVEVLMMAEVLRSWRGTGRATGGNGN